MEAPDYNLPEAAIAQEPAEPRDSARLLVDLPGHERHMRVSDLPDLVGPGDLLVVNTSRVVPARLNLHKATGGAAEVLLLEPLPGAPGAPGGPGALGTWEALVRPGRRLAPGTVLYSGDEAVIEVGERLTDGNRRVRSLVEDLSAYGSVALPPYIHSPLRDPERYQTVYADHPGSVAAPTAGLHLTTELLHSCCRRGAKVAHLDLAVGLGTFRPIRPGHVEGHSMHAERYRVPEGTWQACHQASRVVAVGTTTVRALESAASTGLLEGRTELFIQPGHRFSVVDVLMTNFHQPRSTLLVLLEAFTGPRWRSLYHLALSEGYRFLSFGDAMIVGRALPA
ncbi:MAG TPA: tRNA preQ1(34) S-adenosylmethionine ribosyltransferase-isomerase QueA [Acidimicrobiales bacterium]|nr:tRNA preQ1(34) S-adenosylmethionine ribosyltransferase-isomerase QueA [Acidimicrobiales bacterium]